ncbi:MAG: serine hydrolase [Candidatus Heimdallarchaeota archaeon]
MEEKIFDKNIVKQALHLIDNWLDFQTYIKEIPGIAVGIFVEDEIIFKKEYGYAELENKTKLTDQHLFRIASHSKLFTATAIMKLYHEDKLSIDDRISKYLPWFTSENDKNLQQVRIRHLLTHSSGVTTITLLSIGLSFTFAWIALAIEYAVTGHVLDEAWIISKAIKIIVIIGYIVLPIIGVPILTGTLHVINRLSIFHGRLIVKILKR